jgi:signal peptidase I
MPTISVTTATSRTSARSFRLRRLVRLVVATPFLALAAAALVMLIRPGLVNAPIAQVVVAGQSMEPTLSSGDVVFVHRRPTYSIGDVVAYRVPKGEPGAGVIVIHRIVRGSAAKGYILRGDNKEGVDPWQPKPDSILGSKVFRVPSLGLVFHFMRSQLGLALFAGLITFLIALGAVGDDERGRRGRSGAKVGPSRWMRLLRWFGLSPSLRA